MVKLFTPPHCIIALMMLLSSCEKDDVIVDSVNLPKQQYEVGASGGSVEVIYQSNTDIAVSIPSDIDWVSLPDTRSSNLEMITLSVAPNTSTSQREAIVYLLNSKNETLESLTITQYAMVATAQFSFTTSNNAIYLQDDVNMEVGDNSVITGVVSYYADVTSLVADFDFCSTEVYVGDEKQISGESVNNFKTPVVYTVKYDDGTERDYTIKLTNFTGLPVIFIDTEDGAEIVSKDDYLNADIRVDGAGLFDDLDTTVKIKGRGNSTWSMPKKPYALKFDEKTEIAGFPENKSWVLLANYSDKTVLRNELAFDISRITDLEWTPRSQFVELFLNGSYNGTYQLTDKINIQETRVNVTNEGFLIEVDALDKIDVDDIYFYTPLGVLCNIKDPDVDLGSEQYLWIQQYLTDTENTLYGSDFADSEIGYAKYLDSGSFADWYLVNEIARNNDAVFHTSCYMHIAPGGKLMMGPVWDFDIAFGNINYNDNFLIEGFWVKESRWISRLFEDPNFVSLVRERFAVIKNKMPLLLESVNRNATNLQLSVVENNNKWDTLYNYTWPNYVVYGSYDNEVEYMKNFFTKRMEWLEGALNEL